MVDKTTSALLSIGTVMLLSLFFFDIGHASQIDRSQTAPMVMAAEPNSVTEVHVDPAYILFGVGLIPLAAVLILMGALAFGEWRNRHEDHEQHGHHLQEKRR